MKLPRALRKISFMLVIFMLFMMFASRDASPGLADNSNVSVTYSPDFKLMEVPDPLVGDSPIHNEIKLALPEVGKPFYEPNFGTIVERATVQDPARASLSRHDYSRHDPFNKDKTMIILGESAAIYRTSSFPYNQTSNFVLTPNPKIAEMRWDPNNPNIIWGIRGLYLLKLDVTTGKQTIVKDFSKDAKISQIPIKDLSYITTEGEGESSIDKRYWAFFLKENGKPIYLFSYDLVADNVIGVYTLKADETAINWIGMSSLGNYVLLGGEGSLDKNISDGLVMANKEFTKFHRLDFLTSHSDVGLDSNGKEVILMINAYSSYLDMIYLNWNTKMFTDANQSYKGSGRVPILEMYPDSANGKYFGSSGFHVSGNYPGYCLLSTSMDPGAEEGCWLDKSIILTKLDPVNPRSFYIAKTYDLTLPIGPERFYWDEPQASISSDGAKVVWACNWNEEIGKEQIFMMQADLPTNWDKNNLPTALPTPTLKPTTTPKPTATPKPTPKVIKVKVFGKYIKFKYNPSIVSNVIMTQADLSAKALSTIYKYNSKTKSITLLKGKVVITMKLNSKTAKVGSKSYTLPLAPKIIKVLFVPLKFIAEKLGFKYSFDKKTYVVTIK